MDAKLKIVYCIGETKEEKLRHKTYQVLEKQIVEGLKGFKSKDFDKIVIAYEPVWAIGTGKTATADQAEEVCAIIRGVLAKLYGDAVAEATTIQYGGSMNAKNAAELLSKKNVDGGLIGGASLKAPDFVAIIDAAAQ